MGKKRIAQVLARAGLQLSATTVGRMLAASVPNQPAPVEDSDKSAREPPNRVVTARHPNHVWHVDLTLVPVTSGRWIPWFPFSLPQVWPFVWHVAVVIDHFSRAVMGFAVFRKEPTSLEIRSFLGRAIHRAGRAPRHIISDKGSQFHCDAFRRWCKRRRIKPRYGAVGKYGSIAVIERFIRSLKNEWTRRILIPFDRQQMRRHLSTYARWYNHFRPHQSLAGRTPQEVYLNLQLSNPRFEVRGTDAVCLRLAVSHLEGSRQLPIVELKKAA
jgi:putative transposase